MIAARHVLCALAAACSLSAQTPAGGPEDPQRVERALQKTRAEIDRLLDMRMRHDLGLPVDADDRTFRQDADVSAAELDDMRRQVREEEAQTASLRQRFDEVRRAVERLRDEAAAHAADDEREDGFVTVPVAGARVPRSGGAAAPRDREPVRAQEPSAAPAGETAPAAVRDPVLEDLGLDPLRAQIHGSQDHLRVAQSLFKAGLSLMDRAGIVREQGQPELARQFDDRAKERIVRAIDELAPLLEQKEPPFVALFYLGRCRELLFRYSERHEGLSLDSSREFQRRQQEVWDPFLQISARDVRKAGERGEVQVLGEWGQAAQTAMEHFRWMNVHAGYDARATIESLTWPGESKR